MLWFDINHVIDSLNKLNVNLNRTLLISWQEKLLLDLTSYTRYPVSLELAS